jgi:hypothetical protein
MRGRSDHPSALQKPFQERAPEGAGEMMLALGPVEAGLGDRCIDIEPLLKSPLCTNASAPRSLSAGMASAV